MHSMFGRVKKRSQVVFHSYRHELPFAHESNE